MPQGKFLCDPYLKSATDEGIFVEGKARIAAGASPATSLGEVTVVIPFYNRSALARRLLDSIVKQTHKPAAVIFVDNGSSEGEVEALKRVISTFSSAVPVRYVATERHGNANIARSLGMRLAQSRYVAFLDSDDWWESNHLEVSLKILQMAGKSGVYSGSIIRSNVSHTNRSFDINMLPTPFHLLFSREGWCAQTSTYVVDKERIGGVDWDLRLKRHQDYDFFLNVAYNAQGWAFNPHATGNLDRNDRSKGRNFDFRSMIRFLHKWRPKFPESCLRTYLLLQMDACVISGAPNMYYRYYRALYISLDRTAKSLLVSSKYFRSTRIKLIEASKQLGIYVLLKRMRGRA